jgi:hypothetical protein
MTQHLKRLAATTGLVALATVGFGSVAASAAQVGDYFEIMVPVPATGTPSPAYDPCPSGYKGAIVGVDWQNGTGYRVYGCYKL